MTAKQARQRTLDDRMEPRNSVRLAAALLRHWWPQHGYLEVVRVIYRPYRMMGTWVFAACLPGKTSEFRVAMCREHITITA